MSPRTAGWVFTAVLLGPLVAVATAQAPAAKLIEPEQVRESIQRGIAYLKRQQKVDGSWAEWNGLPGTTSSLCALALLNAGVKPSDPDMQRALGYLRKVRTDRTYPLSLQTMVLCQAEPERDIGQIIANVKALVQSQRNDGRLRGAWGYGGVRDGGDPSNTQFAILALHEAERAFERRNVPSTIPPETWRAARRYWTEGNKPNHDGSWSYTPAQPGSGSMTCAGIASLVICNDMVEGAAASYDAGGRIDCCKRPEFGDDAVQGGLQWLARKFSVESNPGDNNWLLYYLYGVERVGRMTGQRFIGGHDWYREGCEHLVRRQDAASGSWKGLGFAEADPQIATPLALLFLSKGRRPVLLAKLKYGLSDDWDRHRGDVANLTRYVEPRWDLDLTWQTVDLGAASVDDLAQCPVLFMSGNLDPRPESPEAQQRLAQKLRDYLNRGGFLFADANCSGTEFDRGFRALMKLVFPEPEYALKLLPSEHPIWRAEETVDARFQRPVLGVEFGCRTSVVYCPPFPEDGPVSLSCLWELSRVGRAQKLPATVQAQVDAGLAIGINVLAYATNRELKPKEYGFRTPDQPGPSDAVVRGRLNIAALRHPGGCTAAPRALVNLMEAAGNELKIRAQTRTREINITDEALFDFHMVFMHGRTSFRLTEQEREQLRKFVERGGLIFADSICASQAFTESFRREMAAIFPKHKLEPIPASDPMWTPAYGGFELKTVERRDPDSGAPGGKLQATLRKVPPLLDGIKIDQRWVVVFSPYDLSCALEKHDSMECKGYTRADAARIGLNVVLYSLSE